MTHGRIISCPDVWNELLDELSVDRDFYNYRERNEDEIFPWDFIDIGVSKQFLRREYENAKQGKVTPNCKQKCSGCGAASFHAGICMMDRKASGGSAQKIKNAFCKMRLDEVYRTP